jgi:hypothetical protein
MEEDCGGGQGLNQAVEPRRRDRGSTQTKGKNLEPENLASGVQNGGWTM